MQNDSDEDERQNLLDSEDVQCRICFESDPTPAGWINPCKCAGTQEWVHSECLEKWRVTSTQDNSMDQCPTCKYHYKFRETAYVNTQMDKICLGISYIRFGFVVFNVLLLICSSLSAGAWDPKGTFIRGLLPFLPDEVSQALWFLVIAALLNAIYLILFLISFAFIKKKRLYLHWVWSGGPLPAICCLPLRVLLMLVIACLAYYINVIVMSGVVFCIFLMVILNYVNFIKRLDRTSHQTVLPYSPAQILQV